MMSDGRATLASASAPNSTLAFESIDGLPPEVSRKLVANLNDEAGARNIVVVQRSEPATYRVRGYVSAKVDRDKTTFVWVWDVYDTGKRRTLRIAGEERAAPGRRRDAWAAADEPLLRRMAHEGMDRIAGFLNSPDTVPVTASAEPEPSLVTLVSGRDDTPEGAGIFRVFSNPDQPVSEPASNAADAPQKPLPPKAAKNSARTGEKASGKTPDRTSANTRSTIPPDAQAAVLAGTTDGRSSDR